MGRELGQTRTIRTSDGGSLHETLRELDRPHRFGYRIDRIRGPMRPARSPPRRRVGLRGRRRRHHDHLVVGAHRHLAADRPAGALVGRMWHSYARRALVTLESILTA